MPSGSSPRCTATPFTIRLVEVPISVQTPPSMEAYERGSSNREGLCRAVSESASVSGINSATTAVLFTNADKNAVTSRSATTASHAARRASHSSPRTSQPIIPVRCSPSLSTNIAAIVITASLLNPRSPFSTGTSPLSSSVASRISATTSGGKRLLMNSAIAATSKPKVSAISRVIPIPARQRTPPQA